MRILITILILFLSTQVSAQITQPDLIPSRTDQEERAIIEEGKELHDQGKYQEAIQKYKQVLEKDSENILAIYEMAFSYFSWNKHEESLKLSYQGARYKSEYLAKFYTMIGNSLDALGKPDEAIAAFNQAIKIFPDNALIHFNLAVTFFNSGKLDDARSHLKTALQLNPKHASSHYALGQLFFNEGYRVPSTLALLCFLTLEPNSRRSAKAISMLDENFKRGVKSKGSKEIEISLDANQKKGEGDFQPYELMMSLEEAGKNKPEASKQTATEMMRKSLDGLFSVMSEMKKIEKGKFIFDYYFPYFIALKNNNLVTPFTYYIYQGVDTGAAQWIEDHPEDVDSFLKWSSSFPWQRLQ